jgi:hypothetical protein
MSTIVDLSSPEIRKLGWQALVSQLGIHGSLKFMLEYNKGEGNYTKTRREIFRKLKVKDIVEDMKRDNFV